MEKEYPLSYAQRRLWTLHLLEPENHAYNMCAGFRVNGALDPDLVKRAANILVARHEALRSVFRAGCVAPYAVFLPDANLEVRTIDLSGTPPDEHLASIEQVAREADYSPVSLSSFPLFGLSIVKLGPIDNVLLLTAHHMIADDWSRTLFFIELATVYDALAHGVDPSLPPIKAQYADFARHQVRTPAKKRLQTLERYWQKALSGDLSPLQLPAFRPRPAVASHQGDLLDFSLGSTPWLKRRACRCWPRCLPRLKCSFIATQAAGISTWVRHFRLGLASRWNR